MVDNMLRSAAGQPPGSPSGLDDQSSARISFAVTESAGRKANGSEAVVVIDWLYGWNAST
jgi:hypothetical protein